MGGCHGNIRTATMGTDTGMVAMETNTAMAAIVKKQRDGCHGNEYSDATMVTDTGLAVMVTR